VRNGRELHVRPGLSRSLLLHSTNCHFVRLLQDIQAGPGPSQLHQEEQNRLKTLDINNANNRSQTAVHIKLLEADPEAANNQGHQNKINYCTCNKQTKNIVPTSSQTSPRTGKLKSSQVKKIDKSTTLNIRSASTGSISLLRADKKIDSIVCQTCNKSLFLSAKIMDLKNQASECTNMLAINSSNSSTSTRKVPINAQQTHVEPKNIRKSKMGIFLTFLRKCTRLKTEQKAAKTLGIVVGLVSLFLNSFSRALKFFRFFFITSKTISFEVQSRK
jgi:hypothetical protein